MSTPTDPPADPTGPDATGSPSAKTLANRANSQLSTGPKTPEGKAIVSANRTVHGLRSSRPVISGVESAQDWESHRQAILADLAPEGAVEQALAERVAATLWRLNRVTDYEADTASLDVNSAEIDLRITDVGSGPADQSDPVALLMARAASCRRAGHAARRKAEPHRRRAELEEVRLAFFESLPGLPARSVAPLHLAKAVLEVAEFYEQSDEDEEDDGEDDGDQAPGHLSDFEGPAPAARLQEWTAGALRRRIAEIAKGRGWPLAKLRELMADDWRVLAARHRERAAKLTARADDFDEIFESHVKILRRRRGLPDASTLDRIQRYESHLDRGLARALVQLKTLQEARAAAKGKAAQGQGGERVPASAVFVGLVRRDAAPRECEDGRGGHLALNGRFGSDDRDRGFEDDR